MTTGYPLTGVAALFEVPPPEMQVEGILPRGTVTGLTARPGVGKTWLALEMARAIATGTKFLGRYQAKPGNVVYVAQDSSIHDYALQSRKLFKEEYLTYRGEVIQGTRDVNPLDDRLHFIINEGILLEDSEKVKKLADTINAIHHSAYSTQIPIFGDEYQESSGSMTGAALVVLDTLRSLTHVPENDNTLADILFRNIRALAARTGAGILLIHHSGYGSEFRGEDNWRGASAMEGALDNWFHLKHPPKAAPGRLHLKVKRFRGLKPADFGLSLTVDETSATIVADAEEEEEIDRVEVMGLDPVEMVLVLLKTDPQKFFRATEIVDGIWTEYQMFAGVEKESFTRHLRRLLDKHPMIEKGPEWGYRIKMMEDGQSA